MALMNRVQEHESPAVMAAGIGFATLAIIYSTWPIWRALFMLELSPNEAWNAYHADRVLQGLPLYPTPDSLITNNYPPLSFYLTAALSWISALDPAYVGRALSLAGIAVTALAIAACVRQLGGSRLAAAVAGFWFVATSARFYEDYVGVNDPHILGLAITATALAWFLRRQAQGRAPEPAILLMAVAGFHKQTLIATPVTALVWLLAHNWRLGLRASLVGTGFVAASLLVCVALYGYAFIHQLVFYTREFSIRWAFGNLGQLQFIAPAMIIWAAWAWRDRGTSAAKFTALYIAAGLVTYFVLKLGKPIGINAQFELAVATAIGLGLAFHRVVATPLARHWRTGTIQLLILGIVAARLLLSNHTEPYLILASPDYRSQFSKHAAITREEVERVRNIPGPAYCSVTMVCRWAGKAFVFDAYAAGNLVATKKVAPADLQARLAAQQIRSVTIDPRTTSTLLERKIFSFIR
jgi:hypothetical protein